MRKTFASIFSERRKIVDATEFVEKHEVLTTETVDFEGRPVQRSCYKIEDALTRNLGYKSSDFSLESQNAVGVASNPIKCQLQTNEIIGEIERVNNINLE